MSAIETPIGTLQDSKLGKGCSVKKVSMSNTDVDNSIGCSDAFKETIMNLKALNGEGDAVKNNSVTPEGSGAHGSNNLPEQKGLSKIVETLDSSVINSSSPDNTNSCFVKENSLNGKVEKDCIMGAKMVTTSVNADCVMDAKERTTEEILDDIDDELSAGTKHLDVDMEVDDSQEEVKSCGPEVTTDEIINNIKQIMTSSEPNGGSSNTNSNMENEDSLDSVENVSKEVDNHDVNLSSDQLKDSLHSPRQSVSMETSDICNDTFSASTVSCGEEDNSVDLNSTNHEQIKSVPVDGSKLNDESSVLDKSKTKHSYDVHIPFNPLTIGDKVRNSVRDIMSKLIQGKTPELTKLCSKNRSEDTMEAEASLESCDSVTSLETCDTTHKADTKPSPRKDNLFESMSMSSGLSVMPKLDLKMLDKPASVDTVDDEQNTNTEQDSDKSEISDSVELDLKLDYSSESLVETKSIDSLENDITEINEAEEKEVDSEVVTDTSKVDESQANMTKSEDTFNDHNFDSFPNSIQSDTCLIDEVEVDKAIALIDETDAGKSPSVSATVSNTSQVPSSNDGSQSASSESQHSVEKMETSENSLDNDNDLKPAEHVSDELKENSKDSDSRELEESSKQDKDSVTEDIEEPDEDSSSVNTSATNERKRSQDDKCDDSEQPSKRSRLDEVIGKLGSVIGIPPETVEQVDSDSDSEESPHSESSGVKSEAEEAEDVTSVSDEEDDKTSQATSQSSTKTIRLSSKELEALVRTKVQGYLSSHRDEEMEQLQKKVTDLQAANDKWKTQARNLQKQVVELTVLQQKLEKRKAATAALRQITTKCVGVQVSLDEPKQTMSVVAQRLAKTPPKSAATVSHNSVLTQSLPPPQANQNTMSLISPVRPNTPNVTLTSSAIAARNSVTQLLTATAMPRVSTSITSVSSPQIPSSVGVRPQLTQHLNAANTVRSLLDSARVGETVRFQGVTNSVGSSLLVVSPVAQNTTKTSMNNIPKVIDLTADDENQPKPGQVVQTVQVLPGANPSQLRPANIHQIPQQVIRQAAPLPRQSGPLAQTISGTSILLSSPAGTQILNNTANLNRPGGTFQVVTIASGSNIRPGTLLTVVPATSTQLSSVRPQGVGVSVAKQVSPQAMPQLRAAQPTQLTYTTSVRPSLPVQSIRPPPPLVSAPPPQTQSIVKVSVPPTSVTTPRIATSLTARHPAPLPVTLVQKVTTGKPLPPKPSLKISRVSQGIVLSWNVTNSDNISDINSYQLFAYQETNSPAITALWKKVGDVKALPLPMACTLTQFQDGNKYHFAVRAVDQTGKFGEFSEPSTIHLTPKA